MGEYCSCLVAIPLPELDRAEFDSLSLQPRSPNFATDCLVSQSLASSRFDVPAKTTPRHLARKQPASFAFVDVCQVKFVKPTPQAFPFSAHAMVCLFFGKRIHRLIPRAALTMGVQFVRHVPRGGHQTGHTGDTLPRVRNVLHNLCPS